jgi:hypothetical protein
MLLLLALLARLSSSAAISPTGGRYVHGTHEGGGVLSLLYAERTWTR